MSKQIQVNFNHNQVNQVSQFKWSLKLFKMINKCTPFNLTASSDAIFFFQPNAKPHREDCGILSANIKIRPDVGH